jgi:hypothetical protein
MVGASGKYFERPRIIQLQTVIARSEATKQSILPLRGEMDCFASLAMTSKRTFAASPRNAPEPLAGDDGCGYGAFVLCDRFNFQTAKDHSVAGRHCEERSDEAIHPSFTQKDGLLRFARNDV